MQPYTNGVPVGDEEFFSKVSDAFSRGAQVMADRDDVDEVRVREVKPKKRGAGVTRPRPGTSKAKRKAQKKARKMQRGKR